MKKLTKIGILLIGLIITISVNAQVTTANNNGFLTDYVGWDNAQAFPLQIRHNANNQPIDFFTDNVRHMRISAGNAIETTTGAPVGGFIGIGPNLNIFSRLTISNAAGGTVGGFRTWMQTGVFSHQNTDNMYVGLRQLGNTNDRFDAIVGWGDNPADNAGIDKLRFIFTSPPIGGTGANPRSSQSVNGYEFMLMSHFPTITNSINNPIGHIGIGPMFDDDNLPQNRLHMNAEDNLQTYLQISNELGTGQQATDGLRVGYSTTTATNHEARVEQQENDRLSLFSNSGERIRITQIGALNNGVAFNPGGLNNNLTRIGISHNPAAPITRPLSLLHLGYNVDNATTNDGWRPWMDVGMFTSQNTDNVYLGLKNEENGSDAVLAWGDNTDNPDNFKMVFTIPQSGLAIPSASLNGVEALRMTPTLLQGVFTGIGGDPAANPYFGTSANPTAALEVNAWGTANGTSGLRFTDLNSTATPLTNPGTGMLAVDAEGDVIYVEANQAPNIGNFCANTPNPLAANFEVPLNENNYYFSGQGGNPDIDNIGSSVGIGLDCGDPIPFGKLHVRQDVTNALNDNTSVAGHFENYAPGTLTFGVFSQVISDAESMTAGFFTAEGSSNDPNQSAFGVQGFARDAVNTNGGVYGEASTGDVNFGVRGFAFDGTNSYGVFGECGGFGNRWAGFFIGDVQTTTNYITSDAKFKGAVKDLGSNNALSLINRLQPKNYVYKTADYPSMNLPQGNQYGLIAQEVEAVLPELIKEAVRPSVTDKKGNIIHQEVTYKTVNYIGIIPVLVGAVKEQQHTIDSLNNIINQRLTSLEDRLNGCCSAHSYKTDPNGEDTENNSLQVNAQDIELKNPQSIVLDQNVPNPFAEKTVIGYALPNEVKSAEIIFHNADGKEINRAAINTRGKGEINVYAQDLSSGVYTYTLVADGKVVDTKRMIKK